MCTNLIVARIKGKKGISTNVRDNHFKELTEAVLAEMKNIHGFNISLERVDYLDFLADFCIYRHESRDKAGILPQDLRIRLNNYKVNNV